MPPLRAAERQAEQQSRLSAIGVAAASRALLQRSFRALSALVSVLQHEAAVSGVQSVEEILDEVGVEAPLVGQVAPEAFAGLTSAGGDMQSFLEAAASLAELEMGVITQINDAARVAAGVSMVARPLLGGYVRHLTPPSCARCTILAGRFYRWSDGFLRHPNCDCVMVPATDADRSQELLYDPAAAFEAGQVTDLSEADAQAVRDGADLGQVVNVRRRAAGLTEAGRVLERLGRLTPEGIYHIASDRGQAIELLVKFGYITGTLPT